MVCVCVCRRVFGRQSKLNTGSGKDHVSTIRNNLSMWDWAAVYDSHVILVIPVPSQFFISGTQLDIPVENINYGNLY